MQCWVCFFTAGFLFILVQHGNADRIAKVDTGPKNRGNSLPYYSQREAFCFSAVCGCVHALTTYLSLRCGRLWHLYTTCSHRSECRTKQKAEKTKLHSVTPSHVCRSELFVLYHFLSNLKWWNHWLLFAVIFFCVKFKAVRIYQYYLTKMQSLNWTTITTFHVVMVAVKWKQQVSSAHRLPSCYSLSVCLQNVLKLLHLTLNELWATKTYMCDLSCFVAKSELQDNDEC